MADVTKTVTFGDTETLAAAKINQLVDNARLDNVRSSDLNSGSVLFHAVTPGAPVDGDLRVNSSSGILQAYDGASWEDPNEERVELAFTLAAGAATVFTGMSLRLDYGGADHTRVTSAAGARNATYDAANVGVVVDSPRGPGDSVNVCVKGPCSIRVFNTSVSYQAGAYIYHPGTAGIGTTSSMTKNPEGDVPGSCLFAQLNEAFTATSTTQLLAAFVFGRL